MIHCKANYPKKRLRRILASAQSASRQLTAAQAVYHSGLTAKQIRMCVGIAAEALVGEGIDRYTNIGYDYDALVELAEALAAKEAE